MAVVLTHSVNMDNLETPSPNVTKGIVELFIAAPSLLEKVIENGNLPQLLSQCDNDQRLIEALKTPSLLDLIQCDVLTEWYMGNVEKYNLMRDLYSKLGLYQTSDTNQLPIPIPFKAEKIHRSFEESGFKDSDKKIITQFKKSLIKLYLVPGLFSRWRLTAIRNKLPFELKESIKHHPKCIV